MHIKVSYILWCLCSNAHSAVFCTTAALQLHMLTLQKLTQLCHIQWCLCGLSVLKPTEACAAMSLHFLLRVNANDVA